MSASRHLAFSVKPNPPCNPRLKIEVIVKSKWSQTIIPLLLSTSFKRTTENIYWNSPRFKVIQMPHMLHNVCFLLYKVGSKMDKGKSNSKNIFSPGINCTVLPIHSQVLPLKPVISVLMIWKSRIWKSSIIVIEIVKIHVNFT